MGGIGPPPKDPSRRARQNKHPIPLRVVDAILAAKPDLPDFEVQVKVDGELMSQPFSWPAATETFWDMLDYHPLSGEFTAMDWSYLLDTARIHAAVWQGDIKLAAELRLREAKYGFTPEDRARLRLTFAQATGAEVTTAKKFVSARDRARGVTNVTE
ncbi:hypothetical protein [Arthrobacter sp. E3]|uniref:phage terminase small subunit n=1 Tax=Arthrobacter sp. E3 TaxID=517402 RepID=UPI001A940F8F|nr:hypothetical protein [Arthrobacter sp. E3]